MQDSEIAAALGGFYKLEAKADALQLLASIAQRFIQSKDKEPAREDGSPVLRLWVKGFELKAVQKAEGYRGNFARIWMEFTPAGYYTLKAETLNVPLSSHPQKDFPKGHHPNWGNPTMRAVESGKVLSGLAEAQALLDQLHLDFPGATTPGKQCLHVMLYNRNKQDGAPIDKVTLKIQLLPEGGAKLVLQKKTAKPKTRKIAKPKPPVAGKFTAMVSRKRPAKKS